MLNSYYQNTQNGGTGNNESNLFADLIIETIKQYGMDIQYMPRTAVAMDTLFGEDPSVTFNAAPTIEAYVKDVEGFQGEGDFLGRFGIEVRDSMTLTIAKRRFDQFQSEKLMTETGFNLLKEDGSLFELETATADGYSVTLSRPNEGDLVAITLDGKTSIWEVSFVEHEAVFYQGGRLHTYDIKVELFDYSSEKFNTGNAAIDGVETSFSTDMLGYELLLEDGSKMLKEDGYSFILESHSLSSFDAQADNNAIKASVQKDAILDFSFSNPFGESFL